MRNMKSLQNKIAASWVIAVLINLIDFSTAITFRIYEGKAPGELVGNLNARIRLVNPPPTNFDFQTTGVIKSKVKLDREVKPFYNFTVLTTTGGDIKVNIEVGDINDEFPTFSTNRKTVNVSEAYDVGHIYSLGLQVTDQDIGVNGIHNDSVRIVSGNVGNVFKINLKKRHNYYAVSLELAKKLNWSAQHQYNLNLSATDKGTPRKTGSMLLTVLVQDYNNCPPKFSRQSYVADVSESVKGNTIILNITTSDCDGGKNAEVTYRMNYGSGYDGNRYFSIQQKNRIGQIKTNVDLDYETNKIYKLQVIATDKGTDVKQESRAEVTVHVRDENDNSPVIDRFTFNPVYENAKVNSRVAAIRICDEDSGENGRLNVSLDPKSVFSISKFSQDMYYVYLKTTLDREKIMTYRIIVTATDSGKPPQTSQRSGTLSVLDVNDNPPKFNQDVYTGDISECVSRGSSILTINATDEDEFLNITYHILSSDVSWFGINSTSGTIYVASLLDREQCDKVSLVIQAFDGKFTANCTVVLRIIDSNDNAPQFSNPHYVMTVLENSKPGMFVGKVNASDVDLTSNGHISFSLGYPSNNNFAINKTTGNITTVKKLDREDIDVYNLSIIAHDEGGLQSTAMVTVIIGDVNDNRPFFKEHFYNCSVFENISVGTYLVKVEATDYDIGWNAQISYEIIFGNDDGTFDLDKSNGQITLHKELDREKVDKYVLKFRAIDNGGLTSDKLATIQIKVKDVNDDPPVFQKDKYSFHIEENSSVSSLVGVVLANSYDHGSGGIVSYFIKTVDAQQHFYINDSGPIFTKVKLDHEVQSTYEFLVEAKDHGTPSLFGHVNVTVTVIDINDNFPVWKDDYSHCIELEENHPIGYTVHVFNASDKDSGLNGKVTYSIVSGPDKVFHLDPETGYLSLNMPVDYEQVQLYQFIVNASDSGKPVLWSLLNFNICVIDINDHVPVLHNASVNVSENLPLNALIYTFHAVDKDSGKNGKVWYQFTHYGDSTPPTHFDLSQDGKLTLKSLLDRETVDKYELYILCGDHGTPIKTATPAKLTIYVQDINDEVPVFTKKLSFITTENEIVGTLIGKVKAKDRDLGKNSEIEYSLVNSTDNFSIDPKTGELYNIVELDREKFPIYWVEVKASDKGAPPKSSKETVSIRVQDVNDNTPNFTKPMYYFNVPENVEKGKKVAQVIAVDSDEGLNGEVRYYINTGNLQGDVEVFTINETTGHIIVVAALDREIKEYFALSVVAEDKGRPAEEAVVVALVTVLDVNDHKPEFKVKNDTIYISEKTSVGSVVYWANATDQDKDENGNILYSIMKVNGEQVFMINSKTGAVIVNKTLDYEHTKQYSLRIKASDTAKDNPKKSILRLYINILDSNDNGPIFDTNPYYAYVEEGKPPGTNVLEPIIARDKDSGINSRIVYSIESQSPKAAFKIDPFTAQLSTDVEIDREDVSEYRLVVKAVDQAGEVSERKSETASVIILITDINDCRPVFTSRNNSFIMEDEPVNFTVFYFTAEDKDLHQFGNVTFSLAEGNEQQIFYLDPHWGALILLKPLDREKVHTYVLKIKASDQGSPPLFSITTFTLSVEDVNDNLPRFSKPIYKVNVPENTNVDFLKVQATDLDGSQLTYSLPVGFVDDLFIINESTGQISTRSPLDGEKQQLYKLTVYVEDNGYPLYTDSATVLINVTDKNDNTPTVLHNLYKVKVMENSPAGYLYTLIAQDLDIGLNARLQYSIEKGNNFNFAIDKNTGTLSTRTPLDRENGSLHNLTVKVEDQGKPSLSTEIEISVIVLDENDNNPKFNSSEVNIILPGGSQPGTEVTTLTAKDSDDHSSTSITYSFDSEQEMPFALDSTKGLIHTLSYLNGSDTYSFFVNASDGSESGVRFGSVKVNVFVDRLTRSPLRFTKVLYEVHFDKEVKAGDEILQLQLRNKHLMPGEVEYVRKGGQKIFAVGQKRGNVSFTEDPRPGAYLFSVRATLVADQSFTSVCFVLVTIQFTIKRPTFYHPFYYATLNESVVLGTAVRSVKPYTPGNLSYQIVNGNEFDAFKIDANGEVSVNNADALDYERSRRFELDIKGDWGNTVTNIAFTKLYITLRNLNDKAPVFRQKVFISSISESSTPSDNRFVAKLYAFNFGDSQMLFEIISGNENNVFALDRLTGKLSLQTAVNREERSFYNLTASVRTDHLSSRCTVLVFITDINDNEPQLPKNINFTIFENIPLGSHVGQINATDKDDYSVLTYSFSGKTQRNGPFVIDLYTGILRLVNGVDFETEPNVYSMDVRVSDQVHEKGTKVFVTVLDENDHKPIFEKCSYNVKRKEPISANTHLARINATDEDQGENKRITYSITSNDDIGIDPYTGIVFTKKEKIYIKDFIDLIINATDHGSPKLFSQVPFRLQILDVNNKIPIFDNDTHVTISEDIEVGTEVVRITPKNSESLAGKKRISYQILSGDELKMFRIEERTGIIRVRRQLDRENTDLYNLDVIAKDSSKSDISDRIAVYIKIDDVNDNTPVFQPNKYYVNDSMYETTITEDLKPPHHVLSVEATDKDDGRNKEVIYSISSGNNDGWFSIMNEKELWLVKPVDRDVIPIHRLSVRATDQGIPPRASDISVVIKVNDTNDNVPVFAKPKNLGVAENAPNGTYAGTIKASDSDSGANQNISFFIVNGTGLGKFSINQTTGDLISAKVFDYEKKSSYTLVVKAQDHGTPPKYSTLSVIMPIIGVDEFVPTFQVTSYKFVVPGDAKKGDKVGHVLATDSDSGPDGEIQYGLNSPIDLFVINNTSGVLLLTKDVAEHYKHRRNRRDTDSSNQQSYNLTIFARSGRSDSKVGKVTAEITLNYTAPPVIIETDGESIPQTIQTLIIAVSVAFAVLLAFLIWLVVKCKKKEGTETKKPSEEMVLGPIPNSVNPVDDKGLINNRYEHIPTSASNSLVSGSSGNGSSDVGFEPIDRRNVHTKKQMDSNVTDSGIQPYSEGDSEGDFENSDARSSDVRSDRTDRIIAHLPSIESLHDFDDEGGREASGGLDVGNLLYAKCAEADAEEDDHDRPRVFHFEGRPDYTGSLSSILGSHEELRGHYNYFYAMNQGPQYQPLSEVFSEIGRLPSKELGSPMNDINYLSARTSMLSSVSSLQNQHLDPESTYSSLPMTPNFTPAITPLVTRYPSLSPLASEVVTPMVSPSQSRPSSMYLPSSRPSSSLIQLAEQGGLDDFDEDVHV